MSETSSHTLDPSTPARILFMGTPAFAVPTLRALVNAQDDREVWPGGARVVGAVTRPDKPAGRGRQIAHSPVKQAALDVGITVLQPGPLRRPEALVMLADLAPDLIVVAAFGQILPADVLHLPGRGCLNVHASLLPRWRGASPIAAAIRAGDAETGVTIMLMDEGLDTGGVISSQATPIAADENTGALTQRLADIGAQALIVALPGWLSGAARAAPQDSARATMTRPLRKEDGRLDWSLPAADLARLVRAMSPWPGAYTTWNGRLLKTLDVVAIPRTDDTLPPGACYRLPDGSLACACGEGALALRVIQLEGKRALSSAETLRGRPDLAQATFGQPAE